MLHAAPEVPEPHPTKRTRNYTVLLVTVLLVSSLIIALVFAFPIIRSLFIRRLTSFDWSGYSVASDLNSPEPQVTKVNGSWTVPTVKVSAGDTYSAVWIGVGGQFDDTLIQAGTEQDSIDGKGTYSAWYELLPSGAITIDLLKISPGDGITVSISLDNSTTNAWSIEINDVTSGRVFHKSVAYVSAMLSAEWIVERPTVNDRIATLANFGQMTFTGCTATLGSKVGASSSFPYIQVVMYNRGNAELASVSPITSNGSSFSEYYRD